MESINPGGDGGAMESRNPGGDGGTTESINPGGDGGAMASKNHGNDGGTMESRNPGNDGGTMASRMASIQSKSLVIMGLPTRTNVSVKVMIDNTFHNPSRLKKDLTEGFIPVLFRTHIILLTTPIWINVPLQLRLHG